ncbi:MAG: hypothetical protein NXI31_07665 [bacterium]|nr:hypothetical protein [bacterium]
MTTAFVFPGLDGVQRAIDFKPLTRRPRFLALWERATTRFGDDPDFRSFHNGLLRGDARLLPSVRDWRWPALAVATMQLALAEELTQRGIRPSFVTGYSIGNVARSLFAGIADHDALLEFTAGLGPIHRGCGVTVIAFGKNSVDATRAIRRLGAHAEHVSHLSDRIFAVPVETEAEEGIRSILRSHGMRLFELAPCGLHGPMQRAFANELRWHLDLARLAPQRIPVLSSQTQRVLRSARDHCEDLSDNVATPFDFAATVRRLHADHGIRRFVNVGPGRHAEHFVQHTGLQVEVVNAVELLASPSRTAIAPNATRPLSARPA